jgi:hypothetical protein
MTQILLAAILMTTVVARHSVPAQPDPSRCRVIRQTLERLRADRAATSDAPRLQQLDEQLRSLAAQEATACGGSNPAAERSTPPGPITPPPPRPGPDAPANPNRPPLPVDPMDWVSEWEHEFGTFLLLAGRPDQAKSMADQQLRVDNAFGPKVQCDGRAVYTGRVAWNRAAGGFDRAWSGQVFACTNGDFLEGKISNFGAHAAFDPDSSASFKIAITDRENGTFGGSYRVYDTKTASVTGETRWSGKGGLTLETAVRRVLTVLARRRIVAMAPSPPARTAPLMASLSRPRSFSSRLSGEAYGVAFLQTKRIDTCNAPLWGMFGDFKPTADDEKAMAVVVQASRQNARRLADVLERVLDDDAANGMHVYVLLGRAQPNIIYNSIAGAVPKDHKVMRYQRARVRHCEQKEKQDLERWTNQQELMAAVVTDVLGKALESMGIPDKLLSLPIDYITLNKKLLETPKPDVIDKFVNAALISKLFADAVTTIDKMAAVNIPANSEFYKPSVTAPVFDFESTADVMGAIVQSEFVKTAAVQLFKRFMFVDHTDVLSEIKDRIDAASTEGDWLARHDTERTKQAENLVWLRSMLAAFNRIFESQKWPTDKTKYSRPQELLFADVFRLYDVVRGTDYYQWEAARAEVVRQLNLAREQMILLAYFSGLDGVKAPAP